MIELKEWYSLIGAMATVFVVGFGIVRFINNRLDKKVDIITYDARCETVEKEMKRGEKQFGNIQKTLLDLVKLTSVTKTKVEGVIERIDRANGSIQVFGTEPKTSNYEGGKTE